MFLTRAAVPARISVSRLATARSRHNVRNVSAAAMKDLPVDEIYKLHQGGEYPYLDVRTPEEFVQGHASGAVNIPVMVKAGFGMAPNPDFVAEVKKVFTDPSKEIIVGCKSGKRSAHACSLIGDAYPNLINNASGFDGWLASGFPVHK